jgi:hypothetical protein
MDRLSGIRNPVMTAATTEIAVFELGTGTKCMDRVAILFDHNAFIFPGFWDIDGRTGKMVRDYVYTQPSFLTLSMLALESQAYRAVPKSCLYRGPQNKLFLTRDICWVADHQPVHL